ncbi:MAG: hypothetical protein HJJLKODD_00647 [Phycisphaerae bacterium]|nr:hypothetical protein [Phycisphaerae bacterium]
MGLLKYIKVAFKNRWNLLLFLGGMGFALLSGRFDIWAPIVVAGEVTFLGLLGSHPKFQSYVEAQEAQQRRGLDSAPAGRISLLQEMVERILDALPQAMVQRFDSLRERCRELRQLTRALRDPHAFSSPPAPLEEMHLAGLDRLLWFYLRLLYTRYSLEQFLSKTDERKIENDIITTQQRLKEIPTETSELHKQKFRKVLEDNLTTSQNRLTNFRQARDNFELVGLELESLENKIRSISEQAINRQEPEFISGQVDQIVSHMAQTEQTMSELQFLTGLETTEENVPQLLERETA